MLNVLLSYAHSRLSVFWNQFFSISIEMDRLKRGKKLLNLFLQVGLRKTFHTVECFCRCWVLKSLEKQFNTQLKSAANFNLSHHFEPYILFYMHANNLI